MKLKSLFIIAAASVLPIGAASAVSFNLQIFNGTMDGVDATSQGLIVVDTAGDGFVGFDSLANQSFSVGQTLAGGDDLIISSLNFMDAGGGTWFYQDAVSVDTNNNANAWFGNTTLAPNQPVGMFWFPDGTSNEGSTVGFFRDNTNRDPLVVGSTTGWMTPSEGFSTVVGNATAGFGGSTDQNRLGPNAGLADAGGYESNFGTIGIPEPSSAMLLFTGLAGLLFRRRR